jgi:hypothetical protein
MRMVVVIRGRAVALLFASTALAACQVTAPSTLPPRISTPSSSGASATKPSPVSAHDLIVKTYVAYWPILVEAGKSSPDSARELLKPYVKGEYLDHLVDGVRKMAERNREPYGQVLPGLKEVRVGGAYAEVIDCQDVSETAMADRRTHLVIPGTSASKATANIKASLERSYDGQWQLTGLSIREAACKPPSL